MNERIKDSLYSILYVANVLTDKEAEVRYIQKQFDGMTDEITKITGLELWHTEKDGGKYFWVKKSKKSGGQASERYESRGWAIRKLIEGNVEWV